MKWSWLVKLGCYFVVSLNTWPQNVQYFECFQNIWMFTKYLNGCGVFECLLFGSPLCLSIISSPSKLFYPKDSNSNLDCTAKKGDAVYYKFKLNQHYENDLAYKNYHTWWPSLPKSLFFLISSFHHSSTMSLLMKTMLSLFESRLEISTFITLRTLLGLDMVPLSSRSKRGKRVETKMVK